MQIMIQRLHLKTVHYFLPVRQINNVFIDEVNQIYIVMPKYHLIEYSDNYSDTSESWGQFKRDKVPADNADLGIDNGVFNSHLNIKQLL